VLGIGSVDSGKTKLLQIVFEFSICSLLLRDSHWSSFIDFCHTSSIHEVFTK